MNKKYFYVCTFLLLGFNGFSQDSSGEVMKTIPKSVSNIESVKGAQNERAQFNSLITKMDGTYQFQISKPDYQPLVSLDLLNKIENSRLDNENNIIVLDQFISILVLSKSKITSSSFQKIENLIYVNK